MDDLIIRGGWLITMDADNGDQQGCDIHVRHGRIVAIGKNLNVQGTEIEADGCLVIPGLIDGHRHVWQSLLRGISVNWTLPQYMVEVRSMYCGCFGPEEAYLANYLGGLESLTAGVTTVVDHSHLQKSPEVSDALVRGLIDSRVGGIFCYALQNVPDYTAGQPVEMDSVRDTLLRVPDDWHDSNAAALRDRYFGADSRLKFGVALPEATPYLPAGLARSLFERVHALSPSLITGHWNAAVREGIYTSTLPELDAAGVLRGTTSLTHCNHLSDDDLVLLAARGVGISTCPDTECGMGLGPLLAQRFVGMGGAASLGIDLSSYVQADIFKQARLMLQTERKRLADASGAIPMQIGMLARDALELVTIGAARSLGLSHELGSLSVGKRADIVIVSPNTVTAAPVLDPIASLLFYTDAVDVRTVVANGEIVKHQSQLAGVDLDELKQRVGNAVKTVQKRYNALPRGVLQEVWAGMF